MEYIYELWEAIKSIASTVREYVGDTVLKALGFGLACLLILLNWDVFDIIPHIWCCIRAVLLCLFRLLLVLTGIALLIYMLAASGGSCEELKSRLASSSSQEATESQDKKPAPENVAVPDENERQTISAAMQSEDFESDAEANTEVIDGKENDEKETLDREVSAIISEQVIDIQQERGASEPENPDPLPLRDLEKSGDVSNFSRVSQGVQSPPVREDTDNNNARMIKRDEGIQSPQDGRCDQNLCYFAPCCYQPCCCYMCAARLCARACSPDPCCSPRSTCPAAIPTCQYTCPHMMNATMRQNCQGADYNADGSCRNNIDGRANPQESEEFLPFPTIRHSVDTQEIWKQNLQKPVQDHDPKMNTWFRPDKQNDSIPETKQERVKQPSSTESTGSSKLMTDDVETSFRGATSKMSRRSQSSKGGRGG